MPQFEVKWGGHPDTPSKLARLVAQARAGNRHAEKALKFVERYGRSGSV
jgi:hypothetical protein